jgi:hypothetical protein
MHGCRVDRLHADDSRCRLDFLDIGGDARDQPAAADGDKNRIDRSGMLRQDLHADGALAGDHLRIVVWMHEGEAALPLQPLGMRQRLLVGIAAQHDLRAARRHRVDLDARRGHRHDDHRAAAELLCGERHPLRMVTGARRDHALLQPRRRQPRHFVIRAAQLEREYRLQVLALEEQPVSHALGKRGRELERRFARHVVHPRFQDPFEIVFFQGGRI